MSKGSFRFDPRFWHNIQPPDQIDVSRYFEYDEDSLFLLRKWLRLDEGLPKTIVDVGCGSGYFTKRIIKMAPAAKRIVAIEPDDTLREYAKQKLSTKVEFLKGTAEDIPLPDEFADLTVCHIVLINLPNVHQAVSGMARVTKAGGFVAAIEPGGGGINYYPDPELNDLEKEVGDAFGKGVWDVRRKLMDYSKDLEQKGARFAEVFHSCDLVDVEAHGILSVFLLSDPHRDLDELLQWLKRRLLIHQNDKSFRSWARRGGLSESIINQWYYSKKNYLENIIKHPQKISKTHELQTTSRIVTIGLKPKKAPE